MGVCISRITLIKMTTIYRNFKNQFTITAQERFGNATNHFEIFPLMSKFFDPLHAKFYSLHTKKTTKLRGKVWVLCEGYLDTASSSTNTRNVSGIPDMGKTTELCMICLKIS